MMRYSTAETVLAKLFGAGDVQDKAFRARLKHLKRLGVPLGSSPGKGKKIWYHDEQVFQWALCLELAEFGLDPTVIVRFIRDDWANLFERIKGAGRDYGLDDLVMCITPSLMSVAWSTAEGMEHEWLRLSECHRRIGRHRRAIFINVSALANEIALLRTVADTLNPVEREV